MENVHCLKYPINQMLNSKCSRIISTHFSGYWSLYFCCFYFSTFKYSVSYVIQTHKQTAKQRDALWSVGICSRRRQSLSTILGMSVHCNSKDVSWRGKRDLKSENCV